MGVEEMPQHQAQLQRPVAVAPCLGIGDIIQDDPPDRRDAVGRRETDPIVVLRERRVVASLGHQVADQVLLDIRAPVVRRPVAVDPIPPP